MLRQAQVALGARAHRGGHGVNVGNMDEESARSCDGVVQAVELGAGRRALAFLVAVLSEFLSWWAILLAGVLFAFTSETTDLVIRSAVSVMFVLNVDEIVFSACCPEAIADNMAATNYLVTPLASFVVRQKHWVSLRTWLVCNHYYSLYGHLSVLLALVTGLIMSLRVHVLACSAHPLWQQFVTSDQ